MSDDDETIRRIAREVYNVFTNEGALVTPAEFRAVELASEGLVCAHCSRPVAANDASCRCGSRRAVSEDDVKYRCLDCNAPIANSGQSQCPHCAGVRVTLQDDSATYECERCGTPIRDPESQSTCSSCGHGRAIRRGVKSNPAYSCTACLRPVTREQDHCICGNRTAWRNVEV